MNNNKKLVIDILNNTKFQLIWLII